jgi:hypothetical protein
VAFETDPLFAPYGHEGFIGRLVACQQRSSPKLCLHRLSTHGLGQLNSI